ncbi:MAG: thermonuclease family protein [Pyrinomonadaceae bacterium]
MNISRSFCAAAILLFAAFSSYAQGRFNGTVTRIIDGKTVTIEPQPGVRITLELQNIEVPEPEQQLHTAVRDHLSKLALNQQVSFDTTGILSEKMLGRVFLNGIDLSQQMIRDGAAWYYAVRMDSEFPSVLETSYKETEALARSEKRGVWSISDLKPAWEFRKERAEKERKAEEERINALNEKRAEELRAAPKRRAVQSNADAKIGIETWFDGPLARTGNGKPVIGENGLLYFYDKDEDDGWVGTPYCFLNVYDGADSEQVMIAIGYDYQGDTIKKGGDVFSIGVGAYGKTEQLLKDGKVEIIVNDKEKIVFTGAKYTSSASDELFSELITYKITRSDLSKIAKSSSAVILVGKFKSEIHPEIKEFLLTMLKVTGK